MNFILPLTDSTTQASGMSGWVLILYIAVLGVAMYFLMIRPQRKQKKKEEEMRNAVQIGDEIVTIGGLYGRIVSIKEDSFVLESPADHSKVRVARWAVQTVLTAHEEESKPVLKEKDKEKAKEKGKEKEKSKEKKKEKEK